MEAFYSQMFPKQSLRSVRRGNTSFDFKIDIRCWFIASYLHSRFLRYHARTLLPSLRDILFLELLDRLLMRIVNIFTQSLGQQRVRKSRAWNDRTTLFNCFVLLDLISSSNPFASQQKTWRSQPQTLQRRKSWDISFTAMTAWSPDDPNDKLVKKLYQIIPSIMSYTSSIPPTRSEKKTSRKGLEHWFTWLKRRDLIHFTLWWILLRTPLCLRQNSSLRTKQ